MSGTAKATVRLRAIAVVVEDGEVLLVNCVHGPGYWVPPGGGVRKRESAQEAARREVAEETGLQAGIGDLLAYREVFWPQYTSFELYLGAKLVGGRERQAAEPELSVKWAAVSELPGLPHFPERLAELCARLDGAGPALYLGALDLREG